jgi:hypothetical protein
MGIFICSARGGGRRDEVCASVAPCEGFAYDLGCKGEVGGAGGAFEVVRAGAVEFIRLCRLCRLVGVVAPGEVVKGGWRDRRGWGGARRGVEGCEAGG